MTEAARLGGLPTWQPGNQETDRATDGSRNLDVIQAWVTTVTVASRTMPRLLDPHLQNMDLPHSASFRPKVRDWTLRPLPLLLLETPLHKPVSTSQHHKDLTGNP